MTEVLTRKQFEAFIQMLGESLEDTARHEMNHDVSSALGNVAHVVQSFDIDYLFSPHADHNGAAPVPEADPLEDYLTRPRGSAQVRKNWGEYLQGPDFGDVFYVLREVFIARWAHSMTLERTIEMTNAFSDRNVFSEAQVRSALSRAVRADVLRSRVEGGTRYWENVIEEGDV